MEPGAGLDSDLDADMDAEVQAVVQPSVNRTSSARRQKRWAVSVQRRAPRPAACKRCGETFEEGGIRVCAWAQQNRGQFYHIACCRDALSQDTFSAVGLASDTHVGEVRTALANTVDSAPDINMEPEAMAHPAPLEDAWENGRLPRRTFWENLSWDSVLKLGRTTWV